MAVGAGEEPHTDIAQAGCLDFACAKAVDQKIDEQFLVAMDMPARRIGRGSKAGTRPVSMAQRVSSMAQSTAPPGPLMSEQSTNGVPVHDRASSTKACLPAASASVSKVKVSGLQALPPARSDRIG
jgi:hypothetical protein